MAILKILKDGDELLRKKSREVTEITPRIITLLDDMKDTLHKANGCGLAAPQVGVLRRIVLVEVEDGKLYEMINPEIIERSEELQHELEGVATGKAAGFANDIGIFENAGVARVQEVITNSISIFPHNCLLDSDELSPTDKLSFYWLPARLNTFAPMSRATGASF